LKIAMIDPSLFTLPYDSALCAALMARGCDVTLYGRELRSQEFTPREAAPRAFFYRWSERPDAAAPSGMFHVLKGLEHAADLARLARVLRTERPKVVHFQWLPLPAIDMIAVRRIRRSIGPVVLTVHDVAPFNNSPKSAIQRIGSKSVWREFDHLIVHSESSRTLLVERGLSPERISTISHGILDVPKSSGGLSRDSAPLTILLFGRIKAYKGVDVMIEALGRLSAPLRARCQVLVAGEPMIPVQPLMRRAEALGVADSIVWKLGYATEDDMGKVFCQADIFAFPYREIDTSGVLMSCLPYGKPIIASGIGAFQKLLRNGTHGRIVPPDDPIALAEAIETLLADPELLRSCGRNVGLPSTQIPSWDVIAERTSALYEALVRARENAVGAPMTQPMAAA
jgi:glycosyltransferase involved in cell wall biosynthesis